MLPIVRDLAHSHRTGTTNRRLGAALAFVAGAANAGGFLAVGRYTSHMTGIVSAMADDLVLGQLALAASGFAALLAFLVGATSTTIAIHWARKVVASVRSNTAPVKHPVASTSAMCRARM